MSPVECGCHPRNAGELEGLYRISRVHNNRRGRRASNLNMIHTNTLCSNPPTSIHKTSSNKSIPLSEQKTVDVS